jgi:hypothetical protein
VTNVARIRVSYDLLATLLRLPDGATVVRVQDNDEYSRTCFVTVVGPMYPEVYEGWFIPIVDHEVTA